MFWVRGLGGQGSRDVPLGTGIVRQGENDAKGGQRHRGSVLHRNPGFPWNGGVHGERGSRLAS
jgi:hypothetical protein